MNNINDRQLTENQPYQQILRQSLQGELRLVNSAIPREQKTLAELREMKHPYVVCSDGSSLLFKKKELEYLSDMLAEEERAALLLPILIEINTDKSEITVLRRGDIEEKVIGKLLKMPLTVRQNRIVIYKPQLANIRKHLKTATQYVFINKIS